MSLRLLIIGAGGQGQVVADALLFGLEEQQNYELVGYLDDSEDLWGKIVKPILEKIFEFLKSIGTVIWEALQGLWENVFKPILAKLGQALVAAFLGAVDVFKKIGGFIWEGMKAGWEALKDGFATIFDGAGKVFKAILNPFIKLFNALKIPAAAFDMPKVLGGGKVTLWPEIDLIPGDIQLLATGGGVKPMGTDSVPALLTPGEFIMSRPAVNAIGTDTLKAMNKGLMPAGDTTQNIVINLEVNNSGSMDENFVRTKLMPTIKNELKRASLDGQYVLSAKGVR